ncbi:MatE_and transmembrane domain-containing protein [Hexamita inflata]|uniref:MatE and transmembrane domain-containing protein n=1 Tax=Hexamita inflata TaxID=28002 RepID=A0AA86U410_9EUKA|nr:MatE and transmembrane domain-containing protein [Hexamita inflata]
MGDNQSQRSQSVVSYSSSIATANQEGLRSVLINPTQQVMIETNLFPTIGNVIFAICELIIMQLIFVQCGYLSVVTYVVGNMIQYIIRHVINSTINGSVVLIQQRLLSEQYTAANMIFDHTMVLSFLCSIIISIILWAQAGAIQTKVVTWETSNYLKLILMGNPITTTFSSSIFLVFSSENSTIMKGAIEMGKYILKLLITYLFTLIVSGLGNNVTLEVFAYSEIITNVIMAIGSIAFFYDTKKKQIFTIFKIGPDTLKGIKWAVFSHVFRQQLLYLVVNSVQPIVFIMLIASTIHEKADSRNSDLLAIGLMIFFYQISTSLSDSLQNSIPHMLVSNLQLKRYDRISSLIMGNFLSVLGIGAILNLIFFYLMNQLYELIYVGLTYDKLSFTFSQQDYKTTNFSTIHYLAFEAMFRPFQSLVVGAAGIFKFRDCQIVMIALQYVFVLAVFYTIYSGNSSVIQFAIIVNVALDFCAVFAYIIILIRINRNRTGSMEPKVNESGIIKKDDTADDDEDDDIGVPTLEGFIDIPKPNQLMTVKVSQFVDNLDQHSSNNIMSGAIDKSGVEKSGIEKSDKFQKME